PKFLTRKPQDAVDYRTVPVLDNRERSRCWRLRLHVDRQDRKARHPGTLPDRSGSRQRQHRATRRPASIAPTQVSMRLRSILLLASLATAFASVPQ
ncbi:hypothetical protein, partial [Xanthomonas bromi]|uniref:hypothetical protein n=1 Tax=Xanthomonas bromi TaxID=56449 RepID=UPI001ADFD030